MAETHLKAAARPLSPHLSIFRPLITMVMSIVHRITGGALYFGMLFGSWLGRLMLFGFTWALIHHLLGGIRHLFWDAGIGFEPRVATMTAWAILVGSIGLTLLVWIVGYALR
jgi:succinate dehydrogenase / fumarate reductase cytochrome b subunit